MSAIREARTWAAQSLDRTRISVRQVGGEGAFHPVISSVANAGLTRIGFGEQREDQLDSFSGWVYSVVRPIAQAIAGQPVHIGRVRRRPSRRRMMTHVDDALPAYVKNVADNLEVLESHPFLDMMHHPNSVMTTWALMYSTIASLELTAWSYWWLTKNARGKPTAWPLPPSWVEPKHEGELFSSWVIRPGGGLQTKEVPREEVVPFNYPDPSNPVGGISPLQAQAKAVVSDEAIQTAQERTFANGIWPGMAIIMGDMADPGTGTARPMIVPQAEKERIVTAIKDMYQGVHNYNEPLILDAMIKDVKAMSNRPKDMDFLDSGKTTKARIAQGFGVNPIILGEVEGANRASAAVASEHFADYTVNPKIMLLSQAMNVWLAPRFQRPGGDRLIIWIEPLKPRDAELKQRDEHMMLRSGAITYNELRIRRNLPPFKVDGRMSQPGTMEELSPEVETAPRRAIVLQDVKAVETVAKADHRAIVALFEKQHANSQAAFARIMRGFFDQQVESILAEVRKAGDLPASVENMFQPEQWDDDLRRTAGEGLALLMGRGAAMEFARLHTRDAAEIVGDLEFGFSLPPDVVTGMRAEMTATLQQPYWSQVNATTQGKLSTVLEGSVAAGHNLDEFAAAIQDAMGPGWSKNRALIVARTETTGALNAGSHAARLDLMQSGDVRANEWLAILDSAVRPTHAGLDGKLSKAPDFLFQVGNQRVPYPGHHALIASQRINCLLPGAVIEGHVEAAMRSSYRGDAVEVVTAGGRVLRVTQNHPILTEGGWVAAGELKGGDNLVASVREVESFSAPKVTNEDQEPAKVEEIFSALAKVQLPELPRARTGDFHGDGQFIEGEIEVVRTDRALLGDVVSTTVDGGGDGVFVSPDVGAILLPGERPHSSCGHAVHGTSTCDVGVYDLGGSLAVGHAGPLDALRFGAASDLYAALFEESVDERPAVAGRVGEVLDRLAGQVAFDQVVGVRHFSFCGHVYDLQSTVGVIIADGVYMSNCRCTSVGIISGPVS